MSNEHVCPNCGATEMTTFHEARNVPVHSVLLLETRQEALDYPQGTIRLGLCHHCGFITNVDFDPALHEYSQKYEATQSYSPTFNRFHRNLAQRLIDRYDLHDKQILEIGCGQGEFLILLCELGPNRGTGFDPAYDETRVQSPVKERITFIPDFYSEKYADYQADIVVCKMTLEHILDTAGFMRTVRRAIGDRLDTIVFFQVPNVDRVLRDCAFWDIYYEHCSYFSAASLAYLFRETGFEVINTVDEYDEQYLMIEARPAPSASVEHPPTHEAQVQAIADEVETFTASLRQKLAAWREELDTIREQGQRAVIWGSGSKGVSFLTTLAVTDEIGYAVDINPLKHGTFMAGTGHEIVSPEFLRAYQPNVVIVMNPVYCEEIQRDLDEMQIEARMLALT